MSVTDKSVSNEEIKARYFAMATPIDRHGNFVELLAKDDEGREGFCTLLHYHLLKGMTDKQALDKLKERDISPLESAFLLKKTKEFIQDVLEIDLDTVRKGVTSTENYLYREVQDFLGRLNNRYEDERHRDIEIGGKWLQADEASRTTLSNYIQSETSPKYWVDTANNRLEPFELEDCKMVLGEIVKRDQELHETMTDIKRQIRILAEQRNFTAVKELAASLELA